MKDFNAFWAYLQRFCEAANLTATQLAELVGCTPEEVFAWKEGNNYKQSPVPDKWIMLHLIQIFSDHMTPDEAIDWIHQAGYRLSHNDLDFVYNKDRSKKDLVAFGKHLREYRNRAGFTLNTLAGLISCEPEEISKWENPSHYTDREWRPNRERMDKLVNVFFEYTTRNELIIWVQEAGYRLSRTQIREFFPEGVSFDGIPQQIPHQTTLYVERTQLEQAAINIINTDRAVAIVGIGGVGKTLLASRIAWLLSDQFADGVIWIQYDQSMGMFKIYRGIADSFEVTLLEYTDEACTRELRNQLRDKQYLLVVDDMLDDPRLDHLNFLLSQRSCLLLTTRDGSVPEGLNIRSLEIGGLTQPESLALLAKHIPVERLIGADKLVSRIQYHPLTLCLCIVQLSAGMSVSELLARFDQGLTDLNFLNRYSKRDRPDESVVRSFDLSFESLDLLDRKFFAKLGYFGNSFTITMVAEICGISVEDTRDTLLRLRRFHLIELSPYGYRLHALLKDYAEHQLTKWPEMERKMRQRHATWFVRYVIYPLGRLGKPSEAIPPDTELSNDVSTAVKWSTANDPKMAAWAFALLGTDQPLVLASTYEALPRAIEKNTEITSNPGERAIFAQVCGDAYNRLGWPDDALSAYLVAVKSWKSINEWLAAAWAYLSRAEIFFKLHMFRTAFKEIALAEIEIKFSYNIYEFPQDDIVTVLQYLKHMCERCISSSIIYDTQSKSGPTAFYPEVSQVWDTFIIGWDLSGYPKKQRSRRFFEAETWQKLVTYLTETRVTFIGFEECIDSPGQPRPLFTSEDFELMPLIKAEEKTCLVNKAFPIIGNSASTLLNEFLESLEVVLKNDQVKLELNG